MDLNDFWQENKRWLLGCIAGLVLFLIARSIVDGLHDARMTDVRWSKVRNQELFTRAQRKAVKEEEAALDAALSQLRTDMHYALPEKYDLKKAGDPELHWTDTYGRVRDALFNGASSADVEFPEDAFSWQQPAELDQIQKALYGVSIVEHTVNQLLAAHGSVTGKDFAAVGLRSISTFRLDQQRTGRKRYVRRRDKEITADQLIDEVKVGFKFEADNKTIHKFLENCRQAEPRIALGGLKITQGRRPAADPLVVTGEMVALTVKPIPE